MQWRCLSCRWMSILNEKTARLCEPPVDYDLNPDNTAPNIPETALGYEVDLGGQWKLLEKWVLGIIAGYWHPGKWFSDACVDRSVAGCPLGHVANNFGNPAKHKDRPRNRQHNLPHVRVLMDSVGSVLPGSPETQGFPDT